MYNSLEILSSGGITSSMHSIRLLLYTLKQCYLTFNVTNDENNNNNNNYNNNDIMNTTFMVTSL